MENVEENLDSQIEEQEEQPVEQENTEETKEETPEVDEPTAEEKIEALELKNKQLFARLKKAEVNKSNEEQPLTSEVVFLAKGGDEEELIELRALAKAKGISFAEAQETPMYKAYKAAKDKEAKSKEAQLGSSTGTPLKRKKEIGNMSDEEHRNAFIDAVS